MGTKYLELIQAKDNTAEKDAQLVDEAAQASLQLESDLIATRRLVALATRKLAKAKSAQPLSGQNVVNAMNELEDYQKGLTILESLKAELFTEQS